jgi:glucosamine--fructose-6-phosphate aminotransferase (isomerizing)
MSFERHLREQPGRLRALARQLAGPACPLCSPASRRLLGSSRVVLTGMGSSFYACYPAYLRMAQAGRPVTLWETAELLHFAAGAIDAGTLVIAVSQSGETVEIVSLLERLPRSQPVLGITNVPGSTVGRRADLLLELGAEPGSYATTQTYVNSLAWLLGVMHAALEESLEAFAAAVEQAAAALESLIEQSFSRADLTLSPGGHLVFLARGPSLASAQQAALLSHEVAGRGAAALSAASFRHGPLEMAGPGLQAVVFLPHGPTAGLLENLARDLAGFGARVLRIADERRGVGDWRHAPVDEELAPVVNIAPVQVLACRAARAAGREPGVLRQAASITRIE